MKYRNLAINATALFIATSILEMTLHEGGHFLAGIFLHRHPMLYHNYVQYSGPDASVATQVLVAAAGPFVSLLIGVKCFILLRIDKRGGFRRLALWYLSVSGFIGLFGYLLIAPFFSYGDTGFVLRALGCPMWAIILIAVLAMIALLLCIRRLAPYAVALMSEETARDINVRRRYVFSLVMIPLLAGIPVITLLNLPTPTFLSILAPLMSPWSIMYAYGDYLRGAPAKGGFDSLEIINGRMPAVWWILLAIVVLMNRWLIAGLGFS